MNPISIQMNTNNFQGAEMSVIKDRVLETLNYIGPATDREIQIKGSISNLFGIITALNQLKEQGTVLNHKGKWYLNKPGLVLPKKKQITRKPHTKRPRGLNKSRCVYLRHIKKYKIAQIVAELDIAESTVRRHLKNHDMEVARAGKGVAYAGG